MTTPTTTTPITSGDFRRSILAFRAVFSGMVMIYVRDGSLGEAEMCIRRTLDFNGHHKRARRLRVLALRTIREA